MTQLATALPTGLSPASRGSFVDPEAVARLEEQERQAVKAGFTLQPPVYALGSRVVALGAENFRRSRQEWDQKPDARLALRQLSEAVAAEKRADLITRVRDVRMLDDGTITRGNGHLLLSHDSFRGFLDRTACPVPGPAAKYLATIPTRRRAIEVNSWIAASDPDATMVIRHRIAPRAQTPGLVIACPREAYAFVSEQYNRAFNVDVLAKHILDELVPGDCRAELTYDRRSFEVKLLWHSDIQPETLAAGEIFRAMAGIRARDDGSMGIQPFAGLDRNLCLNLIILDHARLNLGTKAHTGDDAGIATFIAEALKEATDKVRYFANAWDAAKAQPLAEITRDVPAEVLENDDRLGLVEGVFRGLLKEGRAYVPGHRRRSATELLMAAYKQEPESSRVGVVNAMTRIAHTAPSLKGLWADHAIEANATKVLTTKRPFNWAPAKDSEDF